MYYLSKTFGLLMALSGAVSIAVSRQMRPAECGPEVQALCTADAGDLWYLQCEDRVWNCVYHGAEDGDALVVATEERCSSRDRRCLAVF